MKKILNYAGSYLCDLSKEKKTYPNLDGDRDIEWSFISANIPHGSGEALDFGNGGSFLGLIAARKGFNVIGIDLRSIDWPYHHPKLSFVQGDLLKTSFPLKMFDLIINCSTIEHVGIPGRYDISDLKVDGDLQAMQDIKKMLKESGMMLLTIPVGLDATIAPFHRIYGPQRLTQLLKDFTIEYEEYWVKNDKNYWVITDKTEALKQKGTATYYGIGCFILRNL